MNKLVKMGTVALLSLSLTGGSLITVSELTNDNIVSASKKHLSPSQKQVKKLNKWFRNGYQKDQKKSFSDDGKDYTQTDEFKKDSVIKRFRVHRNKLEVVVSKSRMKSEELTQKDVSRWAFDNIVGLYEGKLTKFSNIDDNFLTGSNASKPQNFVWFES